MPLVVPSPVPAHPILEFGSLSFIRLRSRDDSGKDATSSDVVTGAGLFSLLAAPTLSHSVPPKGRGHGPGGSCGFFSNIFGRPPGSREIDHNDPVLPSFLSRPTLTTMPSHQVMEPMLHDSSPVLSNTP
jgi:hypothetical protein